MSFHLNLEGFFVSPTVLKQCGPTSRIKIDAPEGPGPAR